jgi:hypothetical protein
LTDPDDILASLDFEVEGSPSPLPQIEESFRPILVTARNLAVEAFRETQAECDCDDLALAIAEITFSFVLEYVVTSE